MSQIPITIKIDADLKREAQKLAQKLGLSLSAIVENKLREVVRERRVIFEEDLVPNDEFAKVLHGVEVDIAAERNLSQPFNSFDELEKHLKSLGHADKNSSSIR